MRRILTLLAIVSILMIGTTAQALTLSLIPEYETISQGEDAEFSLLVLDPDQLGIGLGAFDIDILYDPTILEYNYDLVLDNNYMDFSTHDPGKLNLLGSASSFFFPSELATFSFRGIGNGTTALEISVNELLADILFTDPDTGTEEIVSFPLDSYVVENAYASVVPEPSTLMLLGAGLAALVVAARRRCN